MLVTHSSLCDPMDCSLPVSSVHGISQAKILEWVVIPLLQGIFLTQELNLGLLHCRQILYCLSQQGSTRSGGREAPGCFQLQFSLFPSSVLFPLPLFHPLAFG